MKFEWDDAKAWENFKKHHIEFSFALRVFADPDRLDQVDSRNDYGELRINTIGTASDTMILCVTYTARNGVTRIISARPASRKERKQYHHA